MLQASAEGIRIVIYVSKKSLQRPEVKALVEFYLREGRALVLEIGYVPLPEAGYAEGLAAVEDQGSP